jgi:RNA polymerase sigma-70 factor, ECF subfamily
MPVPSFEEVYESTFDLVWRLCANRGVPPGALDDAVQEIFVIVHRKLPEFEGRSSVRTWVAAITRLAAADFLRRLSNRPSGDPLHEMASEGLDPAEALERRRALVVLDEALAKMTEPQREAFLLCDVEQLNSREVAAALGVNDNTIRTRLRAARAVFTATVNRHQAQRRWGVGHG